MESSEKAGFDSSGSLVIVGNYGNYHTCSEEDMFTDKTHTIISNAVATICVKYLIPKVIDTVSWYSTGYKRKLHKNKLNIVLYFKDSLVNILSATTLAKSMRDDEGT